MQDRQTGTKDETRQDEVLRELLLKKFPCMKMSINFIKNIHETI